MKWTIWLWAGLIVSCAGEKPVELKSKEAIGRFRLAVPEVLVPVSRTQSIYGVEVTAGPDKAELWDAKQAAHAEAIVSRPNLVPNGSAFWYKQGQAIILEARVVKDGSAVSIVRDAPPGKEAVAEKLASAILENYHSGTATGFAVGPGHIAMGPSLSESTQRIWETPTQSVRLEFSTLTVTEPDMATFMDVQEEADMVKSLGGTLTVLSQAERSVAGLAGREIRIRVDMPDQAPQVRFTWHFPGLGRDGTKPRVDLLAKSSAAAQKEMEAVWEAMLPSIQPIPVN